MIYPSARAAQFRYAIRNIVSAAEARERSGQDVIYLNIGDPQAYGFRPPAHLVAAVTQALRDKFTGYAHSSGLPEARNAVANYASKAGIRCTPEDVLLTSGASEAADLVLTALISEGDEVLLPAPGYPLYPAILNKLGGVPRYYKLAGAEGWQVAADDVAQLINKRTRALVIINPNNPTGTVIPDATTRALLSLAAQHKLLVIADEVYRELCFGPQPAAASALAADKDVPLITLESLSKTHLVPGWRVGWMRFNNTDAMKELIRAIHLLASGRLCSPTPAQYAVRPALEGERGFLQEFLFEIRKRRDTVIDLVHGTTNLSCTVPQAAFYVMIKVNDPLGRTDERFVLDMLERTGILVVPGSGFGLRPEERYFRLVYLPEENILRTVFDRMAEFLQSIPAGRSELF